MRLEDYLPGVPDFPKPGILFRDISPLLANAKAFTAAIEGLASLRLKQYGDPYQLSISDLTGQVGIDYGVYGVPETFVIDRSGIIRYKHIGPLTKEAMSQKIIPLITKLEQ